MARPGRFRGETPSLDALKATLRLSRVGGLVCVVSFGWSAQAAEVQYTPEPNWVTPPPQSSATPSAGESAPVQVIFFDQQVQATDQGWRTYTAYKVKILTPEGLAEGNLQARWSPSQDQFQVHRVQIHRGGDVIDVLKTHRFRVTESEDRSDADIVTGDVVARLQTRDLRIGDELEVAETLIHSETTFVGHVYGLIQWPIIETRGAFRLRLLWPDAAKLNWALSDGLPSAKVTAQNGAHELSLQAVDLPAVDQVGAAPLRYRIRRRLDFSDFSGWSELSSAYWRLAEPKSKLAKDSEVAKEVARIASVSPAPRARMKAALKLVQDQVRYVYEGLEGGNYRPASADETWERRFGDCKAKSVLLHAMLRELGVPSELVLVNSQGFQESGKNPPSPGAFDHMIVRATIADKDFWLDGTRTGGRELEPDLVYSYHAVLPVRSQSGELETTPRAATITPTLSTVLNIDARAGLKRAAPAEIEQTLRGPEADGIHQMLAPLGATDAQRALISFLAESAPGLEIATADWRFEEESGALVFTARGTLKIDLDGDMLKQGSVTVPFAGFTPPAPFDRPVGQDANAPWALDFPRFLRWTTILHLPAPPSGWAWSASEANVHRSFGGKFYWRESGFFGDAFVSTMSHRALDTELSAGAAAATNSQLATFNNNISTLKLVHGPSPIPSPSPRMGQVYGLDAQRRLAKALTLVLATRFEEALKAIDEARDFEPESAVILQTRADILERLGRWEEALADLEQALRIDPFNLQIASRTAALRTRKGLQPQDITKTLVKPEVGVDPKW